jgi:hypothetical protein
MGGLKSYFHAVGKKGRDGKNGNLETQAAPLEMTTTPPQSSLNVPRRSSLTHSRRSSQYPQGDFRNSAIEEVLDIKSDVMVNFLHQQQMERLWTSHMPSEGVVLKKSRGNYACSPDILRREIDGLFDQVISMNVKVVTSPASINVANIKKCALTVNSRVIKLFLEHHSSNYVPLSSNLRLQVLPSMLYLPTCQKHHFGAFIKDQSLLVVWDDEPKGLIERADNIERSLMKVIWHYDEEEETSSDSKIATVVTVVDVGTGEVTPGELEESMMAQNRPTLLINSVVVGLTLTLLIAALGAGWRSLAQEFSIDGSFLRFALVAATPVQVFVSLVSFYVNNVLKPS